MNEQQGATTDPLLQPERTNDEWSSSHWINGSVSPAQMDTIATDTIPADTTEYPPEAQNAECGHTDDTGLCYCESAIWRCPECQVWLGIDHADRDVHGSKCDHRFREWFRQDGALVGIRRDHCVKCGESDDRST